MGCRRRAAGRLTRFCDSVRIRAVKFSVPLLVLAAISFTACTTDSNRRDLYRSKKTDGYWTRSLETGSYKKRELVDAGVPGSPRQSPKEKP